MRFDEVPVPEPGPGEVRIRVDANAIAFVDLLMVRGGYQVRPAFDPVGGASTEAAFRSLGFGGRHLVIGFTSGEIPALRSNLALLKGASLVGVDLKQFGERRPADDRANVAAVFALQARGQLSPLIAGVLPVHAWRDAFSQARLRETLGRVVLAWTREAPGG